MERVQKAVDFFNNTNYNCCQAIVYTYCASFGLDQTTGLKIASSFGGGMKKGEVCGAVTGALMILGLKYGQHIEDDLASKIKTNELVIKCQERFEAKHTSTRCKEILGIDISTEEGYKQGKEKGLFKKVCPDCIRTAAILLEELL